MFLNPVAGAYRPNLILMKLDQDREVHWWTNDRVTHREHPQVIPFSIVGFGLSRAYMEECANSCCDAHC